MPRVQTVVETPLAVSPSAARDTTLHWPVIQSPGAKCPYPQGSHAAVQWKPNETAQARWRELEAALMERERSAY
jgi:hypothetical protein